MTSTTVGELVAEWVRLETAFHDNLPDQGECGDPSHGKALCQFVYDNSDTIRGALSSLQKEIDAYKGALVSIVVMTDPDNPESYRADDREGCLDGVFATACAALSNTGGHNG